MTTKELKKKHSSRPVGGAETGCWSERTQGKVVAGAPGRAGLVEVERGIPHLSVEKLGGITVTEEQDRPCNPGFPCREIKPQNL